jgi:hypothetical protein
MTAPASGATVSGAAVTVAASVSNPSAGALVQFLRDASASRRGFVLLLGDIWMN